MFGGESLGRPLDDPAANPTRDQLRLRLRGLQPRPPVAARRGPRRGPGIGGRGRRRSTCCPPTRSATTRGTASPLAELLGYFRDCPARHKLLVLQLSSPPDDPRFAPPPGDLATAVMRSLDDTPDPARLCLVACGPGQGAAGLAGTSGGPCSGTTWKPGCAASPTGGGRTATATAG